MSAEKTLDDLIDAGWQVLKSDFDPNAFIAWRKCARDYVVALMGPHHPYAQFFEAYLDKKAKTSVLVVAGILEATKGASGHCWL
jgi:hypothetical protein